MSKLSVCDKNPVGDRHCMHKKDDRSRMDRQVCCWCGFIPDFYSPSKHGPHAPPANVPRSNPVGDDLMIDE